MIAILVIVFITLAASAFTLFGLRHALAGKDQGTVIPPRDAGALFSNRTPGNDARDGGEKSINGSARRSELIERARRGDMSVLSDARVTGDAGLYDEALNALIAQASGRQESLAALVSHVAKGDELRANTELAEKALARWRSAPDRRSTVEMLHVAALSDDAAMYQKVVEEAQVLWQGGRLTAIPAKDLLALIESEYWVLASEARLGGAGFALKRTLADVRRKLAAATPAR